jgi:hypothetical protein
VNSEMPSSIWAIRDFGWDDCSYTWNDEPVECPRTGRQPTEYIRRDTVPAWHDAPTCAGWYWYRAPEHKLWVVEVIQAPSGMRVRFEWGWMDLESTHKKSEWAGPINPPADEVIS